MLLTWQEMQHVDVHPGLVPQWEKREYDRQRAADERAYHESLEREEARNRYYEMMEEYAQYERHRARRRRRAEEEEEQRRVEESNRREYNQSRHRRTDRSRPTYGPPGGEGTK